MAITIKTIRGIAVTNLVIFGLAACSSSPTPWTQDDDPWSSKRSAEEASIPSDEAATDTSLNDPILLAEPEPEVIIMEEPAAVEPELIVAVVVEEELTAEQQILAMSATDYAVQVFAGTTVASIDAFKTSKGLENLMTVKTDRSGSTVYVLVDVYSDRAAADAAAVDLETKIGSKPWVRSMAGLQKIVSE